MEILRNIVEIAVSLTFIAMLITAIMFMVYVIKDIRDIRNK